MEEIADATLDGTRKVLLTDLATVPLLIIDDLGMRKLPHTAGEDLLEIIMRSYERASTLLTSNRPVDDWGKLLGDTAAVTALLDRLLHHAHVLKCGPRSWRTKIHTDLRPEEPTKQNLCVSVATPVVAGFDVSISGRFWGVHRGKRQRTEMRRRLIAAIDLGLREGEMLKVQVKHVDFKTWRITLPPENTKGGATSDRAEAVYAMTARIQAVLEERRFLGPDGFVFGTESGRYAASFDKGWRKLFTLAGLPVGRRSGLVWHDIRHEFISYLADQGAEIHEVKEEAACHKDIRTTERYMTARKERLKALMGKMGNRGIA